MTSNEKSGKIVSGVAKYLHKTFFPCRIWRRGRVRFIKKVTAPPIEVSGRIITIDEIKKLSNVIEEEFSKSTKETENWQKSSVRQRETKGSKTFISPQIEIRLPPSREYILKSADKTQYWYDDAEGLSENGRLFDKRIMSIEMEFSDKNEDKNISIRLEHGNVASDISNNITVSGRDETWVNGVHRTLENVIRGCKEQTKFTPIRRLALVFTLTPIFAWLFAEIIVIMTRLSIPGAIWDASAFSFIFFVFFVMSMFFVMPLVQKLEKLYPSVELVTGPEHMRIEEARRKRLYTIVAYYLVPFIFLIISEVLSLLIH